MRYEGNPGSTEIGEPEFLAIGKLRKPHGVRGELLMEVLTDFPERIKPGLTVYVGEAYDPIRVRGRRNHAKGILIAFDDYHNPEDTGVFRNQLVYVRTDEIPPLPDGEYYQYQLLGLRVVSDQGQELGILTDILETGANDVYIVRPQAGDEILIPAIESVIRAIDLENEEMVVHLLDGLIP